MREVHNRGVGVNTMALRNLTYSAEKGRAMAFDFKYGEAVDMTMGRLM